VTPAKWEIRLLFLALVARLVAALVIGGGFHFHDETVYADTARQLSSGGGFGSEYGAGPAYPLFLALLSLGQPVGVTFLRVSQAMMAALGSVLVFRLADRMFGRGPAVVAGLVYALDPLLVITSCLLYPEAVAALLVPPVVLMALDGSARDSLARSASAGVLLGILALFRPVALILPPIVAGWTALTVGARPVRRLAHVGALGLAFLLVLAPWAVRNLEVHGSVMPAVTAGAETAPVGKEEVARQGLLPAMARWAWANPTALVSRVARQFVQFWELAPTRMVTDKPAQREEFHREDPRLPVEPSFPRLLRDQVSTVTFALELSLALVGLVAVGRRRWRQAVLPLAVILACAVGYAVFAAKLRYRIPVLPLVFLFTGAGAAAIYSFARRGRGEAELG
jgi:4-amino-4-deoxy-L-arabinose transferase-like glycosyltransferase